MSTVGDDKKQSTIQHPPLISKLSADASIFVPGTRPSPPSSPDIIVCCDSPPDLRTLPSSNKNNENLNLGPNLDESRKNQFGFEDCQTEGIAAATTEKEKSPNSDGKIETRPTNDDGWTMASTGQNRRRRPQNNVGIRNTRNGPPKNKGLGKERWPGEMITYDNFTRFVVWSADLEAARRSLAQGRLALILMRGVPGSGKSTLARSLLGNGIICSADDYFVQEDGSYLFDKNRLDAAHSWCLQRATQAMSGGVTPVIIDNTNICLWEMSKYVKVAVRNNYDIHFLEPATDWKWDPAECARRNSHQVPYETIERMTMQYEPVTANTSLRSFLESGILRQPIPRPIFNPTQSISTPSLEPMDISRSSSSSDVIEVKQQETRSSQSPIDDWGSSDSSTWANEVQPQPDTSAQGLTGVEKSPSASSIPKEQRSPHSAAPTSMDTSTPTAQEVKKETPTRRRRLGIGLSAVGMTSGPWQLPTDLVGGLSVADKTSDPGSVFEKNLLTAVTREIGVRDGVTQVTEKHLALAAMNHRRLSLQNSDEYDLEERMVTKSGANRPAVCDTGVQCEHDGSIITTSDSDGFAKAMATLKSCFPQVDVENVEDILTGCGGQLEWAVNVLLDSGYDVDWCTTKESIEKEAEAVIESELSDQSLPSETQDALEIQNGQATSNWCKRPEENNPTNDAPRPSAASIPTTSDYDLVDNDSVLYTMELSVDMAKDLQRTFTPIFPDIPADLLSPSQLKVRLPHSLAAAIFRCWLDSQTSSGFSEGDSDFYSETSFCEDNASQNSRDSFGQLANARHREEDALRDVERQIQMDEQFARQLAAEESSFEPEQDNSQPTGGSANTMASQIKVKRLYELFPSVDRSILASLFKTNNCHLDRTIDMLSDTYDIPKQERTGSSGRGYATRAAQKPVVVQEKPSEAGEMDQLSYQELRQEAHVHYEQRQANFQKAQDYHRKGMKTVAYYYAQRGHLHDRKFKEANERAAQKILQQRRAANPAGVLDLHGLHVSEAIHALVDILREYENRPGKEIKIITGQGLHSTNGPRIKPAVTNYLRQKGWNFMELTPGVLVVTIK